MIKMKCVFNTVNGENTGAYCRTGMSSSYPVPSGSTNGGILMRKHCPNATFYVDKSDGGTNNYYRLIDHQTYAPFKNVSANTKVYMWLGSTKGSSFLSSIDWGATATPSPAPPAPKPNADDVSTFKYSDGLDSYITSMLNKNSALEALKTGTRIIGSPYQFLPETDYRLPNTSPRLGRKFAENIIAEAPIVYFIPGIPSYLPEFDKKNKEIIENYISARYSGDELSEAVVNKITNEEGRYFDFIANYTDYMRYVNLLCRVCSVYMGIGDLNVPGTSTPYKKYDWSRYVNYNQAEQTEKRVGLKGIWDNITDAAEKIQDEIFGDYKYLKLYVDPNASFSESTSNNTTQSQVANLFDTVEGLAKDIQFLSGGDGTSVLESAGGAISDATKALRDKYDASQTSNISKLIGLAEQSIQGSNVIFPEIWGDATYNKSYQFTMNFISPYGDIESIFLNVIMPMMHVIALGLPRQTSANSFTSPFLVKVFSKGWFSCELGIVDSISIEKGGSGDAWNVHGLPNEVKVTISVRDLYTNLMATKSSKPQLFFNNQGLIDFLAVSCGVDITSPNLTMKLESIISSYVNSLFDIPSNYYDSVIQSIRNVIEPMFKL